MSRPRLAQRGGGSYTQRVMIASTSRRLSLAHLLPRRPRLGSPRLGSPRLGRVVSGRALFALGLAATLTLSFGCNPKKSAKQEEATPAASAAPGVERFGDPVSGGKAVALSEVLKEPGRFADKPVTVEGQVRKVCSRKGCWMELAETSDKKGQGCRVTFKDYGFFVPKDSSGAQARAQGIVKTKDLSADEVTHYEEEGATFANKRPDGTAQEVRFVASGVELSR